MAHLLFRNYTQNGENNVYVLELYIEDALNEERNNYREAIMNRAYSIYFDMTNDEKNIFINRMNDEQRNIFNHYAYLYFDSNVNINNE